MKSSEVAEMWEANAETWTRLSRTGYDVYRDALNTPAFLSILPPISADTANRDLSEGSPDGAHC